MTFEQKMKALIDAGFEFSPFFAPCDPGAGLSQAVFGPPNGDGGMDDVFDNFEDFEKQVNAALEYAKGYALTQPPIPQCRLLWFEQYQFDSFKEEAADAAAGEEETPRTRHGLHCRICDTRIFSLHRHDFRTCNCDLLSRTQIFVDGGSDYFRSGIGDEAIYDHIEMPIEEVEALMNASKP